MAQLSQSPKIRKLASDLGIKNASDPVTGILAFCEKKVKKLLVGFDDCNSLVDLLSWIAAHLGTSFEEVHSDGELAELKAKYVEKGEKVFAALETWLSDDVCGITIKRTNKQPWEGEYVSVIDCRGMKRRKAYYTKWHELGHLLILTDQLRLSYMRTLHFAVKDPEEILVDKIAGKFGFYQPIILPHISGRLSFDEIERLMNVICPDSSYQAALIGFVKAWPEPGLSALCQPGLRKAQQRELAQGVFNFHNIPVPELRAVRVTSNDVAVQNGFCIPENMRVPKGSIVQLVHQYEIDFGEAEECLSWWVTSDGKSLPKKRVRVQAKRIGDDVYAIITP